MAELTKDQDSQKKVGRPIKRKTISSEAEDSDVDKVVKKVRKCDKARCPAASPICFVRATNTCCGNGYTSRWYHISAAEHFCNECFEYFYRSTRKGYETYMRWKQIWSKYGKVDSNIKHFLEDQMLPFWALCNLCQKWRQVYRETDLSPDFLAKYHCTIVMKNQTQEDACNVSEDFRVAWARDSYIFAATSPTPIFIRNAVYAPYVTGYFPDGVGISPSDTSIHKYQDGVSEVSKYLHPIQPNEDSMLAHSFPPHYLTNEEQIEFPDFHKYFAIAYLIVRNTCLTLWGLDVKAWVTKERCMSHLHLRGASRIWLAEHVQRIITFLTLRGYINFGLVSPPKELSLLSEVDVKNPVIVVGGGISGLAAARQLLNLGVQVTLLEASSGLGGRLKDKGSFSPLGTGVQVVNGSHNNPIITLCQQADFRLRDFSDKCLLFDDSGEKIDEKTDRRIEFHFNAMLDINNQQRKEQSPSHDVSLLQKFNELHQQFKEESGLRFTKVEESMLQFYVSNLEYACGSGLDHVSSLHWDLNEDVPQFQGPPVLVRDPFTCVMDRLADGVNVVMDAQVSHIDYTDEVIRVKCTSGTEFPASKVVVAVPLTVLKDGTIEFTPSLPDDKQAAIKSLGAGHVEKIALSFPKMFWSEDTKGSDLFGRVSLDPSKRGMFDVFYDLSQPKEGKYVLISYITGNAVNLMKDLTDEHLRSKCMETLHKMFPNQAVPDPDEYYVTRWYKDEHIRMSYSFMPTDASGDEHSRLAMDVGGKVFFAGEATHEHFYQTVAGAYLSGIREAENIYRVLTDV